MKNIYKKCLDRNRIFENSNVGNKVCSWISTLILAMVMVFAMSLWFAPATVKAYDGLIDQTTNHSNEVSMYRYTLRINVANPINTKDADKDALEECSFKFFYKADNGYGTTKEYKIDMSWHNGRNPYPEYVDLFKKPNDDSYQTSMDVWIPGILTKLDFHLNMAGGERLNFSIDKIKLNGFTVSTNKDYVSSAYYDSDGTINCSTPYSRYFEDRNGKRDQYNGVLGDTFIQRYNKDPLLYTY